MPSPVGYDLWLLVETKEYAGSRPDGRGVIPLPPGPVILRGRYLEEGRASEGCLEQERHRLASDDSPLLWVVPSTDDFPHRTAFVYNWKEQRQVQVFRAHETAGAETAGTQVTKAILYRVVTEGMPYAWISHYRSGQRGFFLTGTSPSSDLWRISRMDVDAHHRLLVTLSPVLLAHGIAALDCSSVSDPVRQQYLIENYTDFERAVAGNRYLGVVRAANNLAEAILAHCLITVDQRVRSSLHERLEDARKVMDDPALRSVFPLKEYGYHLAQRIRLLHQRTHEGRATSVGRILRPEVACSAATDISELLVEVALGRY
jgi:hypothetical protein